MVAVPTGGEMMSAASASDALELKLVRSADGFEIDLLSLQGLWTEEMYLKITDSARSLIEFTDGVIEFLPMPTDKHQVILAFIYDLLRQYIHPQGGKVLFAPLRVRVRAGKYREPDILLVRDANDPRRQNRYWLGADLVVEIVSPDDVARDTEVKPLDYAEAGIPEYWIVHPAEATITVLTLVDSRYVEHGMFRRGERATSALLAGFGVSVAEVFDAE
jgi:Uma2 family endonuclease